MFSCSGKTTDQKTAAEIMGKYYISPSSVEENLLLSFSAEQLMQLKKIPWSKEVLKANKYSCILVPGYPLTIMDIRKKFPKFFYTSESDRWYNWYNSFAFAKDESVGVRWYLLKIIKENKPNYLDTINYLRYDPKFKQYKDWWKDLMDYTFFKTWAGTELQYLHNQEEMLRKDEEVPRTCEIVYGLIVNYLVNNEKLMPYHFSFTSNEVCYGNLTQQVYIGGFNLWWRGNSWSNLSPIIESGGLKIGACDIYERPPFPIGICPSLKLPSEE